MNYYALFLDKDSYVEKCLILIKYLSNPQGKSLPHITLRLFSAPDEKLEDIMSMDIHYLNLIEPGAFNMENSEGSFVIYLRCESEELESIDYRPSYYFSRLHITLYEGSDKEYAKQLFELLEENDWHFKLIFKKSKHLTEQKMGTKKANRFFYQDIYEEIIGEKFVGFSYDISNNEKLKLINIVLTKLNLYIISQPDHLKQIKSVYSDINLIRDSKKFIDESRNSDIRFKENQLSFDDLDSKTAPIVEKPVQDAIFVTPPEYAKDMAQCALSAYADDSQVINFGDSAIGTGALFIALKRLVDEVNQDENKNYKFNSAIGVDIDERMAKEAFVKCSERGLTVIYGDAISPDINLGEQRNLMIVNPPYNRHEDIPDEYRQQAKKLAEYQTGIGIKGDAGLYVYHLLIMDKWLADDGIAVWLLPTIFLQARYGDAVRKYLTNNVQLLRLHVYDENKLQFDSTMISTTVVVFKKKCNMNNSQITISYGDSIMEPQLHKTITTDIFKKETINWRKIIFSVSQENTANENTASIKFDNLFDIKRGLATGANSFFVMSKEKAANLGIPDLALKPLLPKSRYLKSFVVDAFDDGYPIVEPQLVLIDCDLSESQILTEYPQFYEYLQRAKSKDENNKDGKAIIERTLVKSRTPWYSQEKREASPYLLTYMGRNKKDCPPLYFILNNSKALALNTYIHLYPQKWLADLLDEDTSLYKKLLDALNKTAEKLISQQTRMYSGGLQKLEPGELKVLSVGELPDKIVSSFTTKQ